MDKKLEFSEDWWGGMSYKNLAHTYGLVGTSFHAVRNVAMAIGLGPRDRIKPVNDVKKTSRKCLMHGGTFMSEGVGNRVCDDCKKLSVWKSGADSSLGEGLAIHGRAARVES